MKKMIYLFTLLFTASIILSSCRDNDDNGNGNGTGNNNPGIGSPTATTDPGVLIGYIDGNPIRWATRNVAAPGTFAQNATNAGMFFQWNRRTGWSSTDPLVSSPAGATWDNTNATGETWTRTNDPCPIGWRVPTRAELDELQGAIGEWEVRSGVNGRIFGSGVNTLFLPAAGHRSTTGSLWSVGAQGCYWGSTAWGESGGWGLWFGRSNSSVYGRAGGFSVRCVSE